LVPSKQGLLTTVAYKIKDEAVVYALEGTVQYCGSLIQWLRDNMNVLKTNGESETLARQVDDNGGVYFVPAFAGLGAPYWDESARGMIIGLTAFNNKSHVVRAALEASAFQIKLVTDAMLVDFNTEITTLKVDGGGTQNSLLMQFQADLSNVPLYRAAVPETTALGVAFAAGLGVGAFESTEHIRSLWRQECAWMPSNARSDKATVTYAMWKRAVDRCTGWIE
jgi:glycerol kinase